MTSRELKDKILWDDKIHIPHEENQELWRIFLGIQKPEQNNSPRKGKGKTNEQ
jgi:hypothetical protein